MYKACLKHVQVVLKAGITLVQGLRKACARRVQGLCAADPGRLYAIELGRGGYPSESFCFIRRFDVIFLRQVKDEYTACLLAASIIGRHGVC